MSRAAAKARARNAGAVLAGLDCRKLVFIDGTFVPELSDLAPEPGLTIGSMANALAKADAGIRWNDPALGIDWPISEPLLSDKDSKAPLLADVPADRLPVFGA